HQLKVGEGGYLVGAGEEWMWGGDPCGHPWVGCGYDSHSLRRATTRVPPNPAPPPPLRRSPRPKPMRCPEIDAYWGRSTGPYRPFTDQREGRVYEQYTENTTISEQ